MPARGARGGLLEHGPAARPAFLRARGRRRGPRRCRGSTGSAREPLPLGRGRGGALRALDERRRARPRPAAAARPRAASPTREASGLPRRVGLGLSPVREQVARARDLARDPLLRARRERGATRQDLRVERDLVAARRLRLEQRAGPALDGVEEAGRACRRRAARASRESRAAATRACPSRNASRQRSRASLRCVAGDAGRPGGPARRSSRPRSSRGRRRASGSWRAGSSATRVCSSASTPGAQRARCAPRAPGARARGRGAGRAGAASAGRARTPSRSSRSPPAAPACRYSRIAPSTSCCSSRSTPASNASRPGRARRLRASSIVASAVGRLAVVPQQRGQLVDALAGRAAARSSTWRHASFAAVGPAAPRAPARRARSTAGRGRRARGRCAPTSARGARACDGSSAASERCSESTRRREGTVARVERARGARPARAACSNCDSRARPSNTSSSSTGVRVGRDSHSAEPRRRACRGVSASAR